MEYEQVVAHLVTRGLLEPRDIVQGDVHLSDHSARHRSVAVRCTTRRGYFIKFAHAADVLGSLDAEARVYAETAGGGALSVLAPWMPAFHAFDASHQRLILGLIDSARTARAAAIDRRAMGAAPTFAAGIGRALAACHSIRSAPDPHQFRTMTPWAFHVAMPAPAIFRDIWPLQLELIRHVQRDVDVLDAVRSLRAATRASSFTHGDIRWANVMVRSDDGVHLVDWEGAGFGDAAWDIGCALQCWLEDGIDALGITESDTLAEVSARFEVQRPAIGVSARSTWGAYSHDAMLDDGAKRELLDRATAFTGLRLLESAYEWARGRTKFTAATVLMLQLGINMLRQPGRERAAFLGLDP